MKLGQFNVTTVSGGRFRSDGGTMFGVVPKVLWSQLIPVDANNCIAQATNCVLVQTGRQKVLIDTGYGPKLQDKERAILGAESGNPIVTSLAAQGVKPEEIDVVILSHLHFDHAGGGISLDGDRLVTTFPKAEYVVQRLEWEVATAGYPELRAAYPQENIVPLETSGQLRLVDGDIDIVPGIHGRITGGHTDGQMALFIYDGGQTAVYLADACPTWRHLPSLWCMSYDMDLLQARRIKPVLLGEIAEQGWWALSDHDPDHAAARLTTDPQRDFAVTEALVTL
ncbi:MAG TPA: MBL fold metallo-hydrolase [Planctomycetaceae bacterium]|jgi:glyoxylase-like metal-dependent hydrolase (beta-lactamase superfamily II)|nr:MBL fold metallo-hydrolase [Planctomycetaceae bacterium]